MIQTYRGWLNDEPESNDTVEFILPQGACVGETWSRRIWQYHNARNLLAKQSCMEVVALKRICAQNKLPKDIYNLLKNEYIKRPVRKLPKTNVQTNQNGVNFVIVVFILASFFLFACSIVDDVLFKSKQHVPHVENFHFQVCNKGEQGERGPPGICIVKENNQPVVFDDKTNFEKNKN